MNEFEQLRDKFQGNVNRACRGIDCDECRHRFNCGYYFSIHLNVAIQNFKDKKRKGRKNNGQ